MSAFGGDLAALQGQRPSGNLAGLTRLLLADAADVKTSTDDECTGLGSQKSKGSMTITTRKRTEHKKCMFYNVYYIIILSFCVTIRLRIIVNRFLRSKL